MLLEKAQMTVIQKAYYSVESLALRKAQKTVQMKDYCSVESLEMRKVQMTVLTKAGSLVVMTAQMMVIRKECYSVVKKVQLIK